MRQSKFHMPVIAPEGDDPASYYDDNPVNVTVNNTGAVTVEVSVEKLATIYSYCSGMISYVAMGDALPTFEAETAPDGGALILQVDPHSYQQLRFALPSTLPPMQRVLYMGIDVDELRTALKDQVRKRIEEGLRPVWELHEWPITNIDDSAEAYVAEFVEGNVAFWVEGGIPLGKAALVVGQTGENVDGEDNIHSWRCTFRFLSQTGTELSTIQRLRSMPRIGGFIWQNHPLVTGLQKFDVSLFLYDRALTGDIAESERQATALRDTLYPDAQMIAIDNWKDFPPNVSVSEPSYLEDRLSEYSVIRDLVLYIHSTPGTIFFGNHSLSRTIQESRLASTGITIMHRVIFEGCSIMGDPEATAKIIARISGPEAVARGYTWFLFSKVDTLHLYGHTEVQVEELFATHYGDRRAYLAPGSPSPKELANFTGEVKLFMLWFRHNLIDDEDVMGADDLRYFLRFDQMNDRAVVTLQDARIVKEQHYNLPMSPALVVTIKDIPAVARGEGEDDD